MICKKCHRRFDGVFCPYCGTKADLYNQDEKKDKKNKLKQIIIGVVVCIFVLQISFFLDHRPKKLDWDEYVLAEKIPVPPVLKGELMSNSETYFSVDLKKYSLKDYRDYKNACIELGYTIEKEEEESTYSAFNEQGYGIDLYYWDYDEELSIVVRAPIALTAITWPSSELAKMIPNPNITMGSINFEREDYLDIYVKMTKDQYLAYVQQCYDEGFNQDYSKSNDTFMAKNVQGYELRMAYEGNEVVLISLNKPDN